MAKQCDICKRKSTKGATRSHSNVKTLKRQNINLQPRKTKEGKKKICSTCLKTMKKNK